MKSKSGQKALVRLTWGFFFISDGDPGFLWYLFSSKIEVISYLGKKICIVGSFCMTLIGVAIWFGLLYCRISAKNARSNKEGRVR